MKPVEQAKMTADRYRLPFARPDYWGAEKEYVLQALDSGWISSSGAFVNRFENEFADLTGSPYALTTTNGTSALHLALLAIDIAPGDEVIVPGFSFMAVANMVKVAGARPVFADVDPDSWLVTVDSIADCVTERTRAVIAVHTYGNVCDMAPILEWSRSRHITVIEDAAEAFMSRYQGQVAGTMATIGCYSFHAAKTITTGEGGMVVCGDEAVYRRLKHIRNHGMTARRYWHDAVGHNYRMTNIQAALGCAQLEQMARIAAERRRVSQTYQAMLDPVPAIRLQRMSPGVDPLMWAVAVHLDPRAFPRGRDGVAEALAAQGIETRPGFSTPNSMPVYETAALPVSDRISGRILCLPTYPSLSRDEIEHVANRLIELQDRDGIAL